MYIQHTGGIYIINNTLIYVQMNIVWKKRKPCIQIKTIFIQNHIPRRLLN